MKEKYQYQYQKLRDASNLLKDSYLQFVLKDILQEENFFNFHFGLEQDLVVFSKETGEKIYLDLSDFNPIFVRKKGDYLFEKICLNLSDGIHNKNRIVVNHTIVEDRQFGILIRELEKCYSNFNHNLYVKDVISLKENTYLYRTNTIGDIWLFTDVFSWNQIFYQLSSIGINPDFHSYLEIVENTDEAFSLNHPNGIQVMVDGVDYSSLYCNLNGKRLISRIYQLYYGSITELNSRDVYWVHLGKLNEDAFGLRKVIGIQNKITEFVGNSVCEKSSSDYQYVEEFLRDQLHTTCDRIDDRGELLRCIKKVEGTISKDKESEIDSEVFLENASIVEISKGSKVKKKSIFPFWKSKKRNPN